MSSLSNISDVRGIVLLQMVGFSESKHCMILNVLFCIFLLSQIVSFCCMAPWHSFPGSFPANIAFPLLLKIGRLACLTIADYAWCAKSYWIPYYFSNPEWYLQVTPSTDWVNAVIANRTSACWVAGWRQQKERNNLSVAVLWMHGWTCRERLASPHPSDV